MSAAAWRRALMVILAGAAPIVSASPAAAQLPAEIPAGEAPMEDRDRFWIGLGVGGGGARFTCDICQDRREIGPAAEVTFGSYAMPELRIGVEAGGWTHSDGRVRESAYRAGVMANLRPDRDRGAYVVGGFGWTHYRRLSRQARNSPPTRRGSPRLMGREAWAFTGSVGKPFPATVTRYC